MRVFILKSILFIFIVLTYGLVGYSAFNEGYELGYGHGIEDFSRKLHEICMKESRISGEFLCIKSSGV